MGIALKGDFIGFWIGNTHSSELGIIRTSDGSRFNENLLPTIQDKTVQVPGGDGFYYFGSYYTQRPFNIPIAFDNMSEVQFRRLKQIIGSKEMVQLVFDEAPYKYYSVKSTGSPTLKYICFDVEDETSGGSVDNLYTQAAPAQNVKRVYKGEGTLSFVAYDPFGYARVAGLDELRLPREIKESDQKNFSTIFDFEKDKFLNQNEWLIPEWTDESGTYQYPLPITKQTGTWISGNEGEMKAFCNCGDLPCEYQIICVPNSAKSDITIKSHQYIDDKKSDAEYELSLILSKYTLEVKKGHIGFCFDSKTNCVYGVKENNVIDTEVVYNQYLLASNFAKMPVGMQTLIVTGVANAPDINIKFKYF